VAWHIFQKKIAKVGYLKIILALVKKWLKYSKLIATNKCSYSFSNTLKSIKFCSNYPVFLLQLPIEGSNQATIFSEDYLIIFKTRYMQRIISI
jgi:hypothetical protein